MKSDRFIRGVLPDIGYRYIVASAFTSVQEIWNRHNMMVGPALLVGEAAVAAFLLAARGMKDEDQTVGLHMECNGPIRRIMSFGRFDGGVRACSSESRIEWPGSLMDGKGSGTMNVSLFRNHAKKIYASSVEFRDQSMARNIEEFLGKSEQVQVFVELGPFAEDERTLTPFYPGEPSILGRVGIFGTIFEALPGATADDTDRLLDYLKESSILDSLRQKGQIPGLPGQLGESSLFHHCDCSVEKVERIIVTMGRIEAEDILAEQGIIEVICEFCCKKYQFNRSDLERIFVENSV